MSRRRRTLILTLGILLFLLAGGLLVLALGSFGDLIPIAMVVMPIPAILCGLIIYKSIESLSAAKWLEASARITRSELRSERRRQAQDVNRAVNVPVVEYEFTIAGRHYQGRRIAIGDPPVNDRESTRLLDRYRAGTSVPVYYNPDDPQDCVLERDAPLRLGCLWSIAVFLLVGGFGLVAAIQHGAELQSKAAAHLPEGAHPIFVLFFAFAGVFILMLLWAHRRQAAMARRWPLISGRIVAADVESIRQRVNHRTTIFYQAVIEYAYEVDGRTYHSTQLTLGGTAASSRRWADAKVACYPVGMAVEVHYDPDNPSIAVLEVKVAFAWLWLGIALLSFAAAAWFAKLIH